MLLNSISWENSQLLSMFRWFSSLFMLNNASTESSLILASPTNLLILDFNSKHIHSITRLNWIFLTSHWNFTSQNRLQTGVHSLKNKGMSHLNFTRGIKFLKIVRFLCNKSYSLGRAVRCFWAQFRGVILTEECAALLELLNIFRDQDKNFNQ